MTLEDLHAAVAELLAAAETSCAVEGSVVGAGVVVAIEGYWQLFEIKSARTVYPLRVDKCSAKKQRTYMFEQIAVVGTDAPAQAPDEKVHEPGQDHQGLSFQRLEAFPSSVLLE